MLDLFAQSMFLATRVTPLARATGRLGQHTALQSKAEEKSLEKSSQNAGHAPRGTSATRPSHGVSEADCFAGDA
ncbi:hypothetical protein [uncultured Roseibium sp.]|uniref:hypothetical protein n=1 Tax=uncultured Roseibium sp. TaxID=1936171 RepID=UPI0026022655|nr:hypothetical protein [uncultured Roseibium sp.]